MYVRFDSLNRHEAPAVYVCNPGSVYYNNRPNYVAGILTHYSDLECVYNFNSISEVNLRAYAIPKDSLIEAGATFDEANSIHDLYRGLQNRRLLFLRGIGYFVITEVIEGYDGKTNYKDIHAESCEVEIQSKFVPFIEDGTYRLGDGTTADGGLLKTLVDTLPRWSIGTVSSSLVNLYRTFEDVDIDKDVYSFMLEEMQDAYECIFIFDIINRQINVLSQSEFDTYTNIHVTRDDLITGIQITENADNLFTAISVTGDEDLGIASVNPLGTNVIYDFSYYTPWMSQGLSEKVSDWVSEIEDVQPQYAELNEDYYAARDELSNAQSELAKFKTQLDMYKRCRNNIVAQTGYNNGSTTSAINMADVVSYNAVITESGGEAIEVDPTDVSTTLEGIDDQINTAMGNVGLWDNTVSDLQNQIESYNNQIEEIHSSIDIRTYFTSEEYAELYNYIYEGSYNDEYITVTDSMSWEERFAQMQTLYNRSYAQLSRISHPTYEYKVDVENFVFAKDFEEWAEQLVTGCVINVEIEDIAQLFLTNFTINYQDATLSMTFGNRLDKSDLRSLYQDVLGSVKKSANSLQFIKETISPIKNGELDQMKESIRNSRMLTKNMVLASDNEQVVIDDTGYLGRSMLDNGDYDQRQIRITGRTIAFTDDSWDSSKVAVGEFIIGDGQTAYGINAETIVGELIVGNSLQISTVSEGGGKQSLLEAIGGEVRIQVSDIVDRVADVETVANDASSTATQALSKVNEPVTEVTTTTGYNFGANGLIINRSGDEITNRIDNTGMFVTRGQGSGSVNMLVANASGVDATNLHANTYLIVGQNSRFEDYYDSNNNLVRTACFYIGG